MLSEQSISILSFYLNICVLEYRLQLMLKHIIYILSVYFLKHYISYLIWYLLLKILCFTFILIFAIVSSISHNFHSSRILMMIDNLISSRKYHFYLPLYYLELIFMSFYKLFDRSLLVFIFLEFNFVVKYFYYLLVHLVHFFYLI